MNNSKISWTNVTWNPVTGCSKVSPGCAHCYAERMDKRIRAARGEEWRAWTPENAEYNVRLHPERLEQPLTWKKPRMVFVNSMSDLFHENVPFHFINKVFHTMRLVPEHTFQILTKRPERMLEFTVSSWFEGILKNVWLGVSVENQRQADGRIPLLLQTPAAVRFLSCEPLLGEIDLGFTNGLVHGQDAADYHVDWVIVGGESGPNVRPMNPDWARSIRDQCRVADVPFFFKQHSGYRPQANALLDGVEYHEFPEMEKKLTTSWRRSEKMKENVIAVKECVYDDLNVKLLNALADAQRAIELASCAGLLPDSPGSVSDAMESVLAEYRALARLAIEGLTETQKRELAVWLDRAVGRM